MRARIRESLCGRENARERVRARSRASDREEEVEGMQLRGGRACHWEGG